MTTYIASIDLSGREMERPFMRIFVEGETVEDAKASAGRAVQGDEVVRDVEPLQPLLDSVRDRLAAGERFGIAFKHESGASGPVVITDVAKLPPEGEPRLPFGSQPDYETTHETTLPWMKKSEAKRLARYLGLTLDES